MRSTLLKNIARFTLLSILLLIMLAACRTPNEAPAVTAELPDAIEEPIAELDEPSEESTSKEKVLIIGHLESGESYDPAHGLNPTSMMVNRATYDTLVTFHGSDASSIEPYLATFWTISNDGLIYTFALSGDITFNNGDPLTADDVVFSFNRLKNVKSNPSYLTDPIESVEAVDDLTVAVTLVDPRPSFLAELIQPVFSIANADQVLAAGGTDAEDAATSDRAQEFLDQNSAGTGPYLLESWTPQDETVLVRNPNYWGEQPYFDRVIIINMPEAATQKVALDAGDIDLATDLTADQVTVLEGDPDLTIFREFDRFTHYLVMNRDPEIGGSVSDPLVALAIRYALDYEGYKELWPGSVTPGTNMWIGVTGAFGPDRAFERNLDRARELLAEAGYPDGFEIEMSYPDVTFGGVNFSSNAQKVQADLGEADITVLLRPMEVQVAMEEYRNGEQGFAYWVWNPDVLDPADFLSFLPGGTVAVDRTHWEEDMVEPKILDLIAQARVETNPEARAEVFDQLQVYAQESSPYAPFMVATFQIVFHSDIEGLVWNPAWGIDIASLSRPE